MGNIEQAKNCIKAAQETTFVTHAQQCYLEAISLLLLELVERIGQK